MRPAAIVALGLVLVACRGTDGAPAPGATGGGDAPGGVDGTTTTCEVRLAPPKGASALPGFREEYADHVGTRVGFRDEMGRELHAFAGIPGEFGEGMPAAGDVELAPGVVGRLSGSGVVWVVEWEEGGPCDPRAALGNGFERDDFLEAIEEAGVAADPG